MRSPDNLYDLLDVTESRPGMYLGSESFSALVGYIEGFCAARMAYRLPEDETPPWHAFSQWVTEQSNARTGSHRSGVTWVAYIRESSEGDDTRALALFFQLLHEYRGNLPDPPAIATARRA